MVVELTPEQKSFVRPALESGRLGSEEEALNEALSLWEERERQRLEILALVDEAEVSLARGEGILITSEAESSAFAETVKLLGRSRLDATLNPDR